MILTKALVDRMAAGNSVSSVIRTRTWMLSDHDWPSAPFIASASVWSWAKPGTEMSSSAKAIGNFI